MAKVTVGNDRTVDSGRNGSQTYGFYVGKAAKLTIRQINIEASNKGVGVLKSQRMRSGKGCECGEAQKGEYQPDSPFRNRPVCLHKVETVEHTSLQVRLDELRSKPIQRPLQHRKQHSTSVS